MGNAPCRHKFKEFRDSHYWCEKCGTMGLAHEPCLPCKLRRLHTQFVTGHPPSDIALELHPTDQRRYEQLREWQAEQRKVTTERNSWPPVPDLDTWTPSSGVANSTKYM